MKNKKSRCFAFILYPDDSNHQVIFNTVKERYNYAYILHDKDVFEETGELKKPHYHVLIQFQNARSLDNVKKELKLDYIEICNFYAYSRYLIHKDNAEKFQYSSNLITTNIKSVYTCLGEEFDKNLLNSKILLDYIYSSNCNFCELTKFAFSNNCLAELRKYAYFYKSITRGE